MSDSLRPHLEAIRDQHTVDPWQALADMKKHAKAALDGISRLEALIRQMIADDRERMRGVPRELWSDDPLKLEAWTLVENSDPVVSL
jgi:hypothetical protein